jgi:hypothetical protein
MQTRFLVTALGLVAHLAACSSDGLAIPEAPPVIEQIQQGIYTLDEEPTSLGCGVARTFLKQEPVTVGIKGALVVLVDVVAHDLTIYDGSTVTTRARSQYWLDSQQNYFERLANVQARSDPSCEGVRLDLEYQLLPAPEDRLWVQASEIWTVTTPCGQPLSVAERDAPSHSCRDDLLLTYRLVTPCSPPCKIISEGQPTFACQCPPGG